MKLGSGFWLICSMILTAALSRMIDHPVNFTPIGAIGLFGAAYLKRREFAYIVPLVGMFLADLVLNNLVYSRWYPEYYNSFVWFANPGVYLGFAMVITVGIIMLRKVSVQNVVASSLAASVVFFLVSNFGSWYSDPMHVYTNDLSGLMTCYAAGLPFFGNTILGDLMFSAVLFGSYEWVKRSRPAFARVF